MFEWGTAEGTVPTTTRSGTVVLVIRRLVRTITIARRTRLLVQNHDPVAEPDDESECTKLQDGDIFAFPVVVSYSIVVIVVS